MIGYEQFCRIRAGYDDAGVDMSPYDFPTEEDPHETLG